jgi:hypothetical protein
MPAGWYLVAAEVPRLSPRATHALSLDACHIDEFIDIDVADPLVAVRGEGRSTGAARVGTARLPSPVAQPTKTRHPTSRGPRGVNGPVLARFSFAVG